MQVLGPPDQQAKVNHNSTFGISGRDRRLKAAIYVDGVLLQEAESTEQYGIASVSGTAK